MSLHRISSGSAGSLAFSLRGSRKCSKSETSESFRLDSHPIGKEGKGDRWSKFNLETRKF
jgi:hypothetical protein